MADADELKGGGGVMSEMTSNVSYHYNHNKIVVIVMLNLE